jgi:hypothetical protein
MQYRISSIKDMSVWISPSQHVKVVIIFH